MNGMYNFSPIKDRVKAVEEWLKQEYTQVRTGRATPALLDSIMVEAYGSKVPVNQVASIAIEDPRTLRIAPWDMSVVKGIEKAIITSNLGLSAAVDERGIRVSFPELTSERRTAILKVAKEKLEEARMSLRAERDRVRKDIQAKEKEGGMSEDERKRYENELQKIIDEAGKRLEETADKKEKEIMS